MVKIKNLQRKIKINTAVLKRIAGQILSLERLEQAELSLVLVGNKRITDINRCYLDQNRATDVIAFRMADGPYHRLNPYLLGDVIISVEMARSQAVRFRRTPGQELCLYLIHGILHLEGYDDQKSAAKSKMFSRQKALWNKLSQEDITNCLYIGKNNVSQEAGKKF